MWPIVGYKLFWKHETFARHLFIVVFHSDFLVFVFSVGIVSARNERSS